MKVEDKRLLLTFIDTPGFGDTRGIDDDKKIVKTVRNFLLTCDYTIDGICLVSKSNITRVQAQLDYVLNQIFAMFDKKVKS